MGKTPKKFSCNLNPAFIKKRALVYTNSTSLKGTPSRYQMFIWEAHLTQAAKRNSTIDVIENVEEDKEVHTN
ncbi:AVN_collapsed_G0046610.mRNA.1.CDS.1 [Saccharomyces cerevisiae]|nr:AVN_collapsed_G0046610.mRNA.1.CDS.1 [Saccharomyces cerevisiae]